TNSANTALLNRENYWSPCSIDGGVECWVPLETSGVKAGIASSDAVGELSDDASGAHFQYIMPSKFIFENMDLRYGDTDGQIVDAGGELIAFHALGAGLLVRKDKFLAFLSAKGYSIVWMLLGEKQLLVDFNAYK